MEMRDSWASLRRVAGNMATFSTNLKLQGKQKADPKVGFLVQ